MNSPHRHSPSGSTLLVALLVVTVLSLILGGVLLHVRTNANTLNQAVSWQQAFVAAEAGVQQAAAQIQTQFIPLLNKQIPPDLTGTQSGTPAVSGTLTNSGEGVVTATFGYVLSGSKGAKGTSFRVLSTGTAEVAGSNYAGLDGRDAVLRKLKRGTPSWLATRQIEAWFAPDASTNCGLVAGNSIDMNNHNITVDSFDSGSYANQIVRCDPNRGPNSIIGYYNISQYDSRVTFIGGIPYWNNGKNPVNTNLDQNYFNANIGTNGQLNTLGSANIFGNAMTNGGVSTGTGNVFGDTYSDFYQVLSPVTVPEGTYQTVLIGKQGATLTGGSVSAPARYKVDSISVSGNNAKLIFDLGTVTSGTAKDSSKSYIDLYVTGDFTTKGGGSSDGSVIVQDGVTVRIYIAGNMSLGGNGIVNTNHDASTLSIYGITPADGSSRSIDMGGNSSFCGIVYAPSYDISLGGGGTSTSSYIGSITGKTATLSGNVAIRYDEALAGKIPISRYKLVSWFENTKQVP